MTSLLSSLSWRYAVKRFDPAKKISEKDITSILKALRLTPSSFGLQPWAFVLVENTEIRQKLLPVSYHQSQVVDASHLLVLCRKTDLSKKLVDDYIAQAVKVSGEDEASLQTYRDMMLGYIQHNSEDSLKSWAEKQVYIALGNAMTVAASLEIDSCPMEGFSRSDYDDILDLGALGLTSVLVLPLGYRHADDIYATKPKVRYELSDLVYRI